MTKLYFRRHQCKLMTPQILDEILSETKIVYAKSIGTYTSKDGKEWAVRGLYHPIINKIVLKGDDDMNEVLIHEAGHIYHGLDERLVAMKTFWLAQEPRMKRVAQYHLVRTIPDELHWDYEHVCNRKIIKVKGGENGK